MMRRDIRSVLRGTMCAGAIVLACAAQAAAQSAAPPVQRPLSLSGPRLGVTFLSDSIRVKLREDEGIEVGTAITQFGWQFEKQFAASDTGSTLVTEWVLLVGGVEQNLFVPSVSWLVGMRTLKGLEFGVGPNLTPVGAALVFAGGRTFRMGGLNVPVNLAVVPSTVTWTTFGGPPRYEREEMKRKGVRVSLLFGFNTRR